MPNVNIPVPNDLHRELKSEAFRKGTYLKDYIIKILMERKENGKL